MQKIYKGVNMAGDLDDLTQAFRINLIEITYQVNKWRKIRYIKCDTKSGVCHEWSTNGNFYMWCDGYVGRVGNYIQVHRLSDYVGGTWDTLRETSQKWRDVR